MLPLNSCKLRSKDAVGRSVLTYVFTSSPTHLLTYSLTHLLTYSLTGLLITFMSSSSGSLKGDTPARSS